MGGHAISDALSTLSVGVTLFFTLSGFLLYRPFAASIARGIEHMPVRAYLRNRSPRSVAGRLPGLPVAGVESAA